MNIEDVLREDEPAIVSETCEAVGRLEHYRRDGAEATRRRVEALYRQLMTAVCARDLEGLRRYAAQVARERLDAGFEIAEVEAAFSALEDAIWHDALARLPHYDQAWGLGLACTALAHGRAALRARLESAAARAAASSLDLTPLFRGVSIQRTSTARSCSPPRSRRRTGPRTKRAASCGRSSRASGSRSRSSK